MTVVVKCLYCGDEFNAFRSSAKYCSDTCRVKYNGVTGKIDGYLGAIVNTIAKLEAVLNEYPEYTIEVDETLQIVIDTATRLQFSIDPLKIREMKLSKSGSLIFECRECGQKVFDISSTMSECQFCGQKRWQEYKSDN